ARQSAEDALGSIEGGPGCDQRAAEAAEDKAEHKADGVGLASRAGERADHQAKGADGRRQSKGDEKEAQQLVAEVHAKDEAANGEEDEDLQEDEDHVGE